MQLNTKQEFIEFACRYGVLRFGEFKTKAGRLSPYFFNTGLLNDGESLACLTGFYARTILDSGIACDMLFGPAYKGIPLVAGTAIALARQGRNLPFCFNRKEAKDHGEGGVLIGAPLKGRVMIVDDVISAGTSVRESVELIRANGSMPCAVVIALDRQERGEGKLSAVQEVASAYGIPVISVATLDDLVAYLREHSRENPDFASSLNAVEDYRLRYGATHA